VSNYAKAGNTCEHNMGYWRGRDYVGLGCSAYGALSRSDGSGWRYRNPPTPARYAQMVAAGDLQPHEIDELDGDARMRERLMLGLRLREGMDIEASARELGIQAWPARRATAADDLEQRGRLLRDGPRLSIPPDAWLWADDTACRLF
jgi:oxygen-independent coproporphyrinogen-3 oxidase